jgi:hypothetical protein
MVLSKALQRFIASGGKIKKLKSQKVPKSNLGTTEKELAQKQFIGKFGDKPQFMGFGEASAIKLAGEELAGKTSRKIFFKKFTKDLSRSRTITAVGIKGKKLKVKTPTKPSYKQRQVGIFKGSGLPKSKPILKSAKSKGALKAFTAARVKEDKVFVKTLSKFTGTSKTPHFKTFWKKLDKPIKW